MKEVLVLGGSYFIGKRLVEILNQSEEKFNISVLNTASKKMKTESLIKNIEPDRNNEEIIIQKLKGEKYDIVFDILGLEKELIECYNWYREHKEYIKYRNYVETEKNILNMMKKI